MMRLLVYTTLLLAAAAARGQEVVDLSAPAETGRRYAVELIIFAYAELDSVGTEVFVPELADLEGDVPEFGDTVAAPDAPDADTPLRFQPLDAAQFTLQETWGRLTRLEAYDPLMHFGWVQETLPDVDPPELALDRFGRPPAGLKGTVSLSLSRFLHLGVDLSLAAAGSAANAAPIERPAGSYFDRDLPDEPVRLAPLRYELRETRIMRSGEIRYYDHPHFGVIARVWRVDEPDAAAVQPQE